MRRLLPALILLALILTGAAGCGRNTYRDVENPIATITMEDGSRMRFVLHLEYAPNTVASFSRLANDGFYDGLEFFRVLPGTLIQSGCPNNDGTGGCDWTLPGEFAKNGVRGNTLSHTRGTLSLARRSGDSRADYDSGSSQFFIMQGNCPEYDGRYAAFGTAADEETLDVIDSIASRRVDSHDVPLVRVHIRTVRVDTHGLVLEPEVYLREND